MIYQVFYTPIINRPGAKLSTIPELVYKFKQ